ncbi:hypothetical protein ACQPWW_03630 [Micromonospora sp. CA-240977]|uniref:hypothetical protein n=1 Tax=Micromonospora sp. CA-240977 TaxID=3239957 RepID=UPI003D945389
MIKSDTSPQGTPIEVFDGIRAGVLAGRSQFFQDLSEPFFGTNRPGSTISQGQRDQFWRLGMQAGFAAVYDCVKAFSETDFTDDQIVPIADATLKSIELVKNATLKVYPGAPHGIAGPYQQELDLDLPEFWKS